MRDERGKKLAPIHAIWLELGIGSVQNILKKKKKNHNQTLKRLYIFKWRLDPRGREVNVSLLIVRQLFLAKLY